MDRCICYYSFWIRLEVAKNEFNVLHLPRLVHQALVGKGTLFTSPHSGPGCTLCVLHKQKAIISFTSYLGSIPSSEYQNFWAWLSPQRNSLTVNHCKKSWRKKSAPMCRCRGLIHYVLSIIQYTAKNQYRKSETNIPKKGIARPQPQFPN